MNKKIIFSSGGTGGHIFPTASIAQFFLKKGYKVVLATDLRGSKYLKKNFQIQSYILNTDTPVGKNLLIKFVSFTKIFLSIIKSLFFLKKEKPNLVFGLGGYVSFPMLVAAKILNIPLIIYENNLILGKTNYYLLPFVNKILLAPDSIRNFPEKYNKKIDRVGHIIREDILNYELHNKRKINEKFSILVLGGSQGTEIFGTVIPETIKKIYNVGYNIKINHHCIKKHIQPLKNFYTENNIDSNVFEFTENILKYILESDIVISRCGASTTAELIHTNTPFIAVPYPYASDNHQYLNAKYYENKGYCWLLEQNNFNNETLFNLVIKILKDKNKLEIIKTNMKNDSFKFTNQKIEKTIRNLLQK